MRAYVLKHYGGPESSLLMDVPAPVPGPRDILVEVRAAGLNPVDFKFRQGKLRAILRPKLPLERDEFRLRRILHFRSNWRIPLR